MDNRRVFKMSFASVYPLYVQKGPSSRERRLVPPSRERTRFDSCQGSRILWLHVVDGLRPRFGGRIFTSWNRLDGWLRQIEPPPAARQS